MAAGPDAWWKRACEQVESARALRRGNHALDAYHHAGQAVEFALKAVFMKRRNHGAMPEECKGAKWHSIPHIASHAGLDGDLAALKARSARIYENWLTVRQWDSNGRFPGNTPSKQDLSGLFLAACHERDGIMAWLETIYQNA